MALCNWAALDMGAIVADRQLKASAFVGKGREEDSIEAIGTVETTQLALQSLFENSFPGGTGDSPVPSPPARSLRGGAGDSPDGFRPVGRYSPEGTRTTIQIEGDALFARVRSAVPVGESPTGAGESPAPPIFQRPGL